jgi:Txe/YoeB family toxin of Txe-Axe toxin-antitoxin module
MTSRSSPTSQLTSKHVIHHSTHRNTMFSHDMILMRRPHKSQHNFEKLHGVKAGRRDKWSRREHEHDLVAATAATQAHQAPL